MENTISELISSALGIALSPIPIVGLFLILLGDRNEKKNCYAYILGWVTGNISIFILALASSSLAVQEISEPNLLKKTLFLIFGVALIFLAVIQFKKRPKVGHIVKTPEILNKMSYLTVKKSFLVGLAFTTLNPVNLLLAMAAGTSVGIMDLTTGGSLKLSILFVFLSTSSIMIPSIVYFRHPVKMKPRLLSGKAWLIQNNSVILSVMLFFIGLSILGKIVN